MTEHEQKVMELVSQAAIYVPASCEGIRIDYWDTDETDEEFEGAFFGTGEETGESYKIFFSEVDLQEDMFYKLVAMEVN